MECYFAGVLFDCLNFLRSLEIVSLSPFFAFFVLHNFFEGGGEPCEARGRHLVVTLTMTGVLYIPGQSEFLNCLLWF